MLHWTLSSLGRLLGRGKLSILIYHQVLAEPDPMRPSEPTVDTFDWQMALIAKYFTPISLDDAVKGLAENNLPANALCVTFDDGYVNNLTLAQPVLEKYAIPATVYVATGFSDGTNMWNDRVIHLFADQARKSLSLNGEHVELGDWEQRRELAYGWLKKLKHLPIEKRLQGVSALYEENNASEQESLMMTPQQVRALSEKGVTIGAHTVNHPILKVLNAEQQKREIVQSKAQLEEWTDKEVRHFAYPNGVVGTDLDELAVTAVKEAGFASAVVTNWGVSTRQTSPWMLQRFTPWDRSPGRFHLRLWKNQAGL
ncbi:polysaccharide deacetylase family protein [Bowmanella pacifica]|uniref:Polysaccharide deacetylase n=2 Tax=Bowmanella TaxID=366580 RepID=A0A917YSN4_9ALTE|nr:polysaccharide deacetylase family protein [Bowmanella pacifica]GGO63770.1 polysaccharide deacetylase [Bowmanella pacifica]